MGPERCEEEGRGTPPHQIPPYLLLLQHRRRGPDHERSHARTYGFHEGLCVHESPWSALRVISALEHPLHELNGFRLYQGRFASSASDEHERQPVGFDEEGGCVRSPGQIRDPTANPLLVVLRLFRVGRAFRQFPVRPLGANSRGAEPGNLKQFSRYRESEGTEPSPASLVRTAGSSAASGAFQA